MNSSSKKLKKLSTSYFYRYGFHRVIKPNSSSCQNAEILDNAPTIKHPTEALVAVDRLILDSTSARALLFESGGDEAKNIKDIVDKRGKMHNPKTSSGGVLLGTVKEIGSECNLPLKIGDNVVPLSSLTCIPLMLDDIHSFYHEAASVTGTAILFDSSPVARIPNDIDPAVAVLSLDISSLVPQVERAVKNCLFHSSNNQAKEEENGNNSNNNKTDKEITILIQGYGKSGLAAMSLIRQLEKEKAFGENAPRIKILGTDIIEPSSAALAYTDATAIFDSRDPIETLNFLNSNGIDDGCDLVLATHNQPDCETSAVMACKSRGTCIFFSMATVFSQANLATDIAGKDITCMFGVGIADKMDESMFELLRKDLILRDHFENLADELSNNLKL